VPIRRRSRNALWWKLRDRQLLGYKFRRQVPVGPFIADFACVECRLIIELDGGQHDAMFRQDANRTALLEGRGWRVMGFGTMILSGTLTVFFR
jgi:adenine-specific DNA-methyltransferase